MKLRKEKDDTILKNKKTKVIIQKKKVNVLTQQLETIIRQNDLNLIDRERTGDIRTISTKALIKDLTVFFKGVKK